ncbi:MAG: GTP 3',8-cyclase MoaA [Oscillospiraceae bacterium]|nr:GTP 3',8-cyclase MoaA [Oscillospiraceae bacterium]
MKDNLNRSINYLRISITDNCNLRCIYCMPKEGAIYHKEDEMITLDEAFTFVKIFSQLGIEKVRITGGEPLLRTGICKLVKNIRSIDSIREIGLTTNGILLPRYLDELYESGLTTLNVSLDTTDEEKYRKMTRIGNVREVIGAIKKAKEYNLKVKLNSLIIHDFNEDEIDSLVQFAIENDVILRFIELMPIGYGKTLKGFKNDDIKKKIEEKYTLKEFDDDELGSSKGPAEYYKLGDTDKLIGFISPISHCFCETCNRVRITSDGKLKECLYYEGNLDLKEELRKGTSQEELKEKIIKAVILKKKQHKFLEIGKVEDSDEKAMSMIGG